MWRALSQATNRTLWYIALGALAGIALVQIVTFGIWGDDGSPPDAVVVMAFVVFWSSILALVVVAWEALRRRQARR